MGYMENTAYFESGNWLEKTNISKHIFTFSKPFPFDYDIFIFILYVAQFLNTCCELLEMEIHVVLKGIRICERGAWKDVQTKSPQVNEHFKSAYSSFELIIISQLRKD